ncbi:MAG: transglutaminase domain-containing protein [Desulfohalobiaceae bacterium]|nr:transglutaminase domain-containing protein [Desulfohalobiaceae bacterium]
MNESTRKKRIPVPVMFWALLLLLAAAFLSMHCEHEPDRSMKQASYDSTKRVRYGLVLENPTNRAVHNAVLWIYAPMKRTATQKCMDLKASREFKRIHDELGHQILRFRFPIVPPFGAKQVNIRAELAVAKMHQPLPREEPEAWLDPDPFVQSSSEPIVSLATQLKADTDKETARNIWNWVGKEIAYSGYTARERGALQALSQRKGDCTEFADLYAALARACVLPTRVVSGFVRDGNGTLRRSMHHNWAQSYFGDGWRLADPQKKVFDSRRSNYVAFSLLGGGDRPIPRGRLYKVRGKGLETRMK